MFFPDRTGLLFNHTFGKTLRDALNTFAVRQCPNPTICPVTNFKRYLSICQFLHINLRVGYLFHNTRGNSVTPPFSSSAARNRLKGYLKATGMGVPQQSIARHIGWSSTNMLDHYFDIREALKPDAPALALASSAAQASIGDVESAYRALHDVSRFIPTVE